MATAPGTGRLDNQRWRKDQAAKAVAKLEEARDMQVPALILDKMNLIGTALQYNGLDLAGVQREVRTKLNGDGAQLVEVLSAIVFVGNKYVKRLGKVVDASEGARVRGVFASIGILETKTGPTSLTPARVAAAFAPIVLCVRKQLNQSGLLPPPNVSTTTPVPYCDLALAPLSGMVSGIVDFLEKFAVILARAANRRAKTDAEILDDDDAIERMHQFRQLAVVAFQADPFAQNLLRVESDGRKWTLPMTLQAYGFDVVDL